MIVVKINCTHNDQGAWCTDKRVKRSLWGFGARCCIEYCDNKTCDYKEKKYKKTQLNR